MTSNKSKNMDGIDIDLIDDLVDFTEVPKLNSPKKSGYKKTYDEDTTEKYRVMRIRHLDPLSEEEIAPEYAFKVENIWDPITGNFIDEKDPYGPLYFNPIELAYYFYTNRLNHLWVDEHDEGPGGGYYQGMYDIGMGAGENFDIKGRGSYPEYYLWRLPIICYIEKGLKNSVPCKGPKLSRDDIRNIYNLCLECPQQMINDVFKSIPDLVSIYDHYTQAISKNPDTTKNIVDKSDNFNFKANAMAVEQLKNF